MRRSFLLAIALIAMTLIAIKPSLRHGANAFAKDSTEQIDFETQVKPILAEKCFDCHGAEVQEHHLRLDQRFSMLRGGDSGEPAIIPKDSEASHLIQLVLGTQAGKIMPPEPADRLTPSQIQVLRDWIDQGAKWPGPEGAATEQPEPLTHWSFLPLAKVSPPATGSNWTSTGIDAFIFEKLTAHQLAPNPTASRAELIRRIYLDMLGLPPTPEEVHEFVNDPNPQAYDRLVEAVLESPHYGERWARYWLDLVRFAETNGFETNRERPNAWPFRDYVIRSLNDDKPYDQFVREQIAGDALGVPEATGYLVAGPYDLVKSPDLNLTLMQRQNELDDIINTTGTAFMGLTLGCARCHNHKFDPIRQSDYYSIQAIFAGIQHGDRAMPLSETQKVELTKLDEQIQSLRDKLKPFVLSTEGNRPSVNAQWNEDSFAPTLARWVRFTIQETTGSEPCLDEIEIFSGDRNVALASLGAKVTCSSTLPGFAIHKSEHLIDGLYGNGHSWISNEPGRGWVEIELPEAMLIDRVVWARDREGKFLDRLATRYEIACAVEANQWKPVSSSSTRVPFSGSGKSEPQYVFDKCSDEQAKIGRAFLATLKEAERRKGQLQASTLVYAGTFQQPGQTHRLFRGEPNAKREPVEPNTVSALGNLSISESTPEQQRRLALAQWIASPENPLTARVIVNRIWQFHFGKGLVATPSDFGKAGVPPSHPELLDWLAQELIDSRWSLKHVHRLILRSSTYRQSSHPRSDAMKIDAGNEWCWRFSPRRLEAEPIRDSILSVTGVLDPKMYGPGFSAFEISMENVRHYFPKKEYGPDDWRRMIYMTKVRLEKDSIFGAFDCPDAATSVAKRSRSTTPMQAMNLFNSPFMLQQSRLFAERLQREYPGDFAKQIDRAFWLCCSRQPSQEELIESIDFAKQQGLEAFCRAMLNCNEFVFIE